MPSVRLMSPQLMFSNAMTANTGTATQGRGTITKGEAEKAIAELGQHPLSSPSERATIVQSFLDGSEGKALSPKAREVLADFVKREAGAPAGGQRADELKATATSQARAAETTLQAAKARLDGLLAEGGRVKKSELAPVQQALDGARAAVDAARGALSGVIQVADHTAKLADTQLKDAQKELKKAQADVARLATQKGGVTKKAVEDVTRWLQNPLAELQAARSELRGAGAGGDITTEKFPSDNEDGGAGGEVGGGGPTVTKRYPSGGEVGGGGPTMSTMKYPSDNEDGGGVGADGVPLPGPAIGPAPMMTRKYPSDNEDGGGVGPDGVPLPGPAIGPAPMTRKYPSDNEDGGGVNADGTTRPGPAIGPAPTNWTPAGGAGADLGHSVTLKFPSDNEDGGAGGGGGMMTTMKAPSDNEDGGPGPAPTEGTPGGPTVKPARTDAMLKIFGDAEARGLKWHNSMPLGQRFESVLLKKERHPDGFAFEAMIPVGALTPTAQRADVNSVDTFWVKRTGGIAGLTQFAGPFTLTAPEGSAQV